MNTNMLLLQKIQTALKTQPTPQKPEFKGYGFVFEKTPKSPLPIPKPAQ